MSWLDTRRERIELKETPRHLTAITMALTLGSLPVFFCPTMLVLTLTHSRLAMVLCGSGAALGWMLSLVSGIMLVMKWRPVKYVLDLGPDGSQGAQLLGPDGALLGRTADGSLRIVRAHYFRPGYRAPGSFKGALILVAHGSQLGALACLGPANLDASTKQIDTPRLGDLYPREYQELERFAPPIVMPRS